MLLSDLYRAGSTSSLKGSAVLGAIPVGHAEEYWLKEMSKSDHPVRLILCLTERKQIAALFSLNLTAGLNCHFKEGRKKKCLDAKTCFEIPNDLREE